MKTRQRALRNPQVVRGVIAVVAVATVAGALLFVGHPQRGTVKISYAFSPDAAGLVGGLIDEFNGAGHVVDGRKVEVVPERSGADLGVASGTALDRIIDGTLHTNAWTPASSLWGRLLEAQPDSSLKADSLASLVQSPQVVATLDQTGTHAGTLATVFDQVRNGELAFAHTDPNTSTSGLSAALAEFYVTAKRAGQDSKAPLHPQDVETFSGAVQQIEHRVAHYVDIARDFKKEWCDYGSHFANAVYMQETTYFALRQEFKSEETCALQRVSAMYPTDVGLVADYPYYVVDAPWAGRAERDAAQAFGDWLDQTLHERCDRVKNYGYHKGRSCTPEGSYGRLPREPNEDLLPEPRVVRDVQLMWDQVRRPANVLVVIERTDENLRDNQLDTLLEILADDDKRDFAACPRGQDRIGLIAFGDGTPPAIAGLVQYDDEKFRGEVGALPDYGRAAGTFGEALSAAVTHDDMQSDDSINTVVVLASGSEDPTSALGPLDEWIRSTPSAPQIVAVLFGKKDDSALAPIEGVVGTSFGRYEVVNPSKIDRAGVAEFLCKFL